MDVKKPARFNDHPFPYHYEGEMTVSEMDMNGVGMGMVDGWKVHVPFVLPDEKVRFRIYKNQADHSQADMLGVVDASPERVSPQCKLFGLCAGCQFQHLSYEGQLRWKKKQIENLFKGHPVEDVSHTGHTLGYRSKITPHFKSPQSGEMAEIGFLQSGYRSRLVDVEQCPIATESINKALPELRAQVKTNASNYKKGATLLLRDSLDGVFSDPNAIIREKVGDLIFHFPAGEFFQNNPYILPDFVRHAVHEAKSFGVKKLVDAYCGSGLFGISSAKEFDDVTGIEISEKSLKWARENASCNQVQNISFQVGEAERLFDGLTFGGSETVVLIDPPRKGCSEEFVRLLIEFSPTGIVYVSCNPYTQVRDVELLTGSGYSITKIQPFDLFPHTRHIENVITLARKQTS